MILIATFYLGTAAVCVAGILASLVVSNTKLSDHKFLFLGAGEVSNSVLVYCRRQSNCKTRKILSHGTFFLLDVLSCDNGRAKDDILLKAHDFLDIKAMILANV